MEKLAIALKLPIIKLVDGSSGGGSVTTIRSTGFSYVPPLPSFTQVVQQLNMGIPNLGAVVGPAIGLGAARVVACHFSVMAGDIGSLFNAGPSVVKNATYEEGLSLTDLGGPTVHCTNGTIDNLAPDEAGCFEQLRTVLSYLPDCGTKLPPTVEPSDPVDRASENLRSIIPRAKNRMYNPRAIIAEVVDQGSFFEIVCFLNSATSSNARTVQGIFAHLLRTFADSVPLPLGFTLGHDGYRWSGPFRW
jgi:acetyl-CoA carboxylase carboxyltransferase component